METLNFGVIAYTWIAYSITLVCLLYISSKLRSEINIIGCLLLSFIGPIIWPIVLVAAAITFFRTPKT